MCHGLFELKQNALTYTCISHTLRPLTGGRGSPHCSGAASVQATAVDLAFTVANPSVPSSQEDEAACLRTQAERQKIELAARTERLQQESANLQEQMQAQKEQISMRLQAKKLEQEINLQVCFD